jgi:hypothetical protein
MYLGEIQYGVLLIASVIATALSVIWYSPYVFGKKDTSITLGSVSTRFVLITLCGITLSALLNSLLITDIMNLGLFILWISFGLCSVFVVPYGMRKEPAGYVSSILMEMGHIVIVVFTLSVILFILQ